MVKGTYKYVPPEMLEELDCVKKSFKIKKDADGFRMIVQNGKIGRELNTLNNYWKRIKYFE